MLNYRSLRGTYYYDLNIKEVDHIVFMTKMVNVMFHETASRKLLVFTLYVNPYMSNGISHLSYGRVHSLVRRHRAYVASDLGLHCLPTSHKMKARLRGNFGYRPRASFLRREKRKVVWAPSFDHFQIRINTGFRYVYVRWIFPHFLDKIKKLKCVRNIY